MQTLIASESRDPQNSLFIELIHNKMLAIFAELDTIWKAEFVNEDGGGASCDVVNQYSGNKNGNSKKYNNQSI